MELRQEKFVPFVWQKVGKAFGHRHISPKKFCSQSREKARKEGRMVLTSSEWAHIYLILPQQDQKIELAKAGLSGLVEKCYTMWQKGMPPGAVK